MLNPTKMPYHDRLALDVASCSSLERIIVLALAQSLGVDISREIAHAGKYTLVKCCAEGKMTPKAHSGGTDSAVASFQTNKKVDTQCSIFIVGRDLLLNLPRVALVGSGAIVGQRLRPSEFVVGRRSSNDVAVGGDLSGEASDWAGHLVDLAEDDDSGKLGLGVVWDGRVEDEDAYLERSACVGG